MILDADVRVLHKTLLHETVGCVEFVDLAVDDILDCLGWFALSLFLSDCLFLGNHFRIDVFAIDGQRSRCRDVEGDVLHERLEVVIGQCLLLAGAHLQQHSNLTAGVNIGCDQAGTLDLQLCVTGELDVLTDLGDLCSTQFLKIGIRFVELEFGNLACEFDKRVILGNEIRFAVDFHQNTRLGIRLNVVGNDALVGFAIGLFRGLDGALCTENVDCLFDVAVGFGQGLFAIHEPCAGQFAEFRNQFCCYFCHDVFSKKYAPPGVSGRLG